MGEVVRNVRQLIGEISVANSLVSPIPIASRMPPRVVCYLLCSSLEISFLVSRWFAGKAAMLKWLSRVFCCYLKLASVG